MNYFLVIVFAVSAVTLVYSIRVAERNPVQD